jgi:hypothetical protein
MPSCKASAGLRGWSGDDCYVGQVESETCGRAVTPATAYGGCRQRPLILRNNALAPTVDVRLGYEAVPGRLGREPSGCLQVVRTIPDKRCLAMLA